LNELKVNSKEPKKTDSKEEETTDPRWDQLKKLLTDK